MYQTKKILALIPARGGSKGLPEKNIRALGNKPLIAWSIDAAKKSRYIDKTIVSTDDEAIAGIARKYNAEVPFMRPASLATDTAKMMDAILHAMRFMEACSLKYDYLVLLQPTTPFRNEHHIDEAIEHLFRKKAKVILGVVESEHCPFRINSLPEDGNMENFYDPKTENLNRQDLPRYYRLNGAIYIAEWKFLKDNKRWFSKNTYAYIMKKRHSIDIDSLEDFLFAESLLAKKE